MWRFTPLLFSRSEPDDLRTSPGLEVGALCCLDPPQTCSLECRRGDLNPLDKAVMAGLTRPEATRCRYAEGAWIDQEPKR